MDFSLIKPMAVIGFVLMVVGLYNYVGNSVLWAQLIFAAGFIIIAVSYAFSCIQGRKMEEEYYDLLYHEGDGYIYVLDEGYDLPGNDALILDMTKE